jgi:HEAT repeat protein
LKRRRVLWLVILVIVAGVAIVVGLDPDRRVQGWLAAEPFYQGRAASAWRRDLRQPEGARTAEAFNALVAGKRDAVPVCVWVLRTAPEPEARWRAADALGRIGKDASAATPELVAAVADDDPLVRGVAVRAIGELAPDVPGGVQALIPLFPDVEAMRAVARFGPAGGEAVPSLIVILKHDDPTVRWQAARALGKIGVPAVPAVPELARLATSDPEPLVREHAAEALGDVGPAAADGIPALVQALHDPVARVRRDAVRALGQMGLAAKGVLADVRALHDDPDADVRAAAGRALRLIDPTSSR